MSKSLGEKLEEMERRFEALERKVVDPEVIAQGQFYASLLRERGRLEKVVAPFRAWKKACEQVEEAESILSDHDSDAELKEMAADSLPELRADADRLREQVKHLAVEEESAPDRDVIMEIRAGTGGDEAALFAADLVRMYSRYAERCGWRVAQMNARATNLGGFKEVTLSISGANAFRRLRFESGGHRVQRVPATEAQGRIHTSLVTVAVLAEAEDVDVTINPADVEMEFFRASGPGGQKVNKTSSAVRLIHKPTGIEATCQDTPSQHKNRAHAMRMLRARILGMEMVRARAERDAERRSKIGSGDRNQRIRTYNFPQNRVTDHRIGMTIHNLPAILDGDINELIDGLFEYEIAEREKGMQLG